MYLSALLLLYGTCKEELLAKLGMTEGEFMKAWQGIFQYDKADQAIFDDVLTPAFRERGIDGLVAATGETIREVLFQPDSPFGKQQNAALQDLMVDDLAALKRNLARRDEGPAPSSPSPFVKGDERGIYVRNRPQARIIRERCNGAVTVVLDFQPMMGGG